MFLIKTTVQIALAIILETCKAAIDAINNKTTNTGDTSSGDNTSDGDTGPDSSSKSSEGTSSST